MHSNIIIYTVEAKTIHTKILEGLQMSTSFLGRDLTYELIN